MKDRIEHIIRAKNLTATEFAEKLGVQPSGISHVLSGRNNPSLDFVKRLKETFPEYNLDWIIFGTGPMTSSEVFVAHDIRIDKAETLRDETSRASAPEMDLFTVPVTPVTDEQQPVETHVDTQPQADKPVTLRSVILVYSDNSFEMLHQK